MHHFVMRRKLLDDKFPFSPKNNLDPSLQISFLIAFEIQHSGSSGFYNPNDLCKKKRQHNCEINVKKTIDMLSVIYFNDIILRLKYFHNRIFLIKDNVNAT